MLDLVKTTLVQVLAKTLDLSFGRIQFTPDLMPSDITGTEVLEEDGESGRKAFRFIRGPIFAHVLLADEINRTPPKTQAALLQAMQERCDGRRRYDATRRAFFCAGNSDLSNKRARIRCPKRSWIDLSLNCLLTILRPRKKRKSPARPRVVRARKCTTCMGAEQLVAAQQLVRRVPVADHLIKYAVKIVRASRPGDAASPEYVREMVNWGAGPRASQYMVLAAKARAVLHGRHSVSAEDVRAVAPAVCAIALWWHQAEAQNVTTRKARLSIVSYKIMQK